MLKSSVRISISAPDSTSSAITLTACSILASAFEINGVSLPRKRSFNSTLILVFLPFNDEIDDLEDELSNLDDEIDDLDEDDEREKSILDAKKATIRNKISSLKNQKILYINTNNNDVNLDFEFVFKGNGKNFYSLLPFLGKEKIEEIAQEKIKGNPKYDKIKLVCLLPFMSKETNDKIFMEYLKDKNKKDELVSFAPFVSKSILDYLCDEYCKGNFNYIDINRFYPFMSKESINKIFDYFLTK